MTSESFLILPSPLFEHGLDVHVETMQKSFFT